MLAFVIIIFVHAEQRNIYKNCTTKGKPRAFRFAVSTDVRCKSRAGDIDIGSANFAVLYN